MNRRQREKKLKAKRDWQAHVKAWRRIGSRTFRVYDGTFAQPIYAGSFLPENMMDDMLEIQVSGHGAGAMTMRWGSRGPMTFTNANPPLALTAAELAERLRVLARAMAIGNGEPPYSDDMPGMTLEEFQAWSDQLIREVQGECDATD